MKFISIIILVCIVCSCVFTQEHNSHNNYQSTMSMNNKIEIDTLNNLISNKNDYPLIGKYLMNDSSLISDMGFIEKLIKKTIGWTFDTPFKIEFSKSLKHTIINDTLLLTVYNDIEADARGVDGCMDYLLIFNSSSGYLFIYKMNSFDIDKNQLLLKCNVRGKETTELYVYDITTKEYIAH